MKIDLTDSRVGQAILQVEDLHKPKNAKQLEDVFERLYYCKIVSTDPPWNTKGYLEISFGNFKLGF